MGMPATLKRLILPSEHASYQKHHGRYSVVVYRLLLFLGFSDRTLGLWLARVIRPSDHAAHMLTFSWKTLALAARFWAPLRYADEEHAGQTGHV